MEHHPELIPRRGELIAWACALLVIGAWVLLTRLELPVSPFLAPVGILLGAAAASISLGNWMDRHTALTIGPEGVSYRNGLRAVRTTWDEIQEVRVWQAPWGERVEVIGKRAYFRFNTLGEVKAHGKIMGRTGFVEGKRILERIVDNAGLRESGPIYSGSGFLYSRR
jgi:hypothetical protein